MTDAAAAALGALAMWAAGWIGLAVTFGMDVRF